MLTTFAFSIAYYFIGGMFVLSADGIVLNQRHIVSASYPATIVKVLVREGDVVTGGTPLLQLESFEMVREIAELSVRASELAVREGELRGKAETIAELLPLAERTAREFNDTVARLDQASIRGLILAERRDEALTSNFQATERFAELAAQARLAESELRVVEKTRRIASDAISKMEAIYNEGRISAAAAGVVGSKLPVPGQVVRLGDELLQINGGKSYLFAYLPDNYLFAITEGMKVDVRAGNARSTGTVEKVLPIAEALPAEFQNMLRPRDRSRLIRIALPEKHPFAMTQKVSVRGCAAGWCWVR
ncbi:HlyD family secretion protein [Chelativorans salis]|uniref:HlyD family secretion protein n=1 Tax=Chelativorans salis TaxID=2978478 RepID=A0ABT2LXM8_9HYPH|nr:HlyD family secretion protein [Chelativorans sp. EGI FJ00035]MCT7378343.1 HlyD family secretion protein [Chelativorans sp. EGI FJ00035]